jgi:hypothetical protein
MPSFRARSAAVLLAATALLLTLSSAAAYTIAPECTVEQQSAYAAVKTTPDKCSVQSIQFESCDDDCLSAWQTIAAKAPNCTISGQDQSEQAAYMLDQCLGYRAVASSHYMPKVSPGLRNCTLEDQLVWDKATDASTGFAGCVQFAVSQKFCSADCLASIETTIKAAPACMQHDGYSMGELVKGTLVQCINAIDGNLDGNTVLQTVVKGDSSAKTPSSTASQVATTVAVVASVVSFLALSL